MWRVPNRLGRQSLAQDMTPLVWKPKDRLPASQLLSNSYRTFIELVELSISLAFQLMLDETWWDWFTKFLLAHPDPRSSISFEAEAKRGSWKNQGKELQGMTENPNSWQCLMWAIPNKQHTSVGPYWYCLAHIGLQICGAVSEWFSGSRRDRWNARVVLSRAVAFQNPSVKVTPFVKSEVSKVGRNAAWQTPPCFTILAIFWSRSRVKLWIENCNVPR